MTNITYPNDDRNYERFRVNGRAMINCKSFKIVDGVKYVCSFRNQREDNYKQKLKAGKPHVCNFIEEKSTTRSVLDYFSNTDQVSSIDLSENGLRTRLAFLLGRKNISLDTGCSKEFYDFIIYCIAYGISIQKKDNFMEEARKAYHHYKEDAIRQSMIDVSKLLDKNMIKEFGEMPYCCVAIDEGATWNSKNLSFNLENPISNLHPYTVRITSMKDGTSLSYVEVLLDGLVAISRYDISIGSVVADGNRAQKKAFSYKWKSSLRKNQNFPWLKTIIYIPCLCHRIHNAYKSVILNHDDVQKLANAIRAIGKYCKDNRKSFGATCPSFVNTRWIFDFDILTFILKHKHKIPTEYEIPEEAEDFLDCLRVMKTYIKIFEDPQTPFFKGFDYLLRGFNNFVQLRDEGSQFADRFLDSVKSYTINSEDAGMWVLAFILSKEGHDKMYSYLHGSEGLITEKLQIRTMASITPKDELGVFFEEMTEQFLQLSDEEEGPQDEDHQEEEQSETEIETSDDDEQVKAWPMESGSYLSKAKSWFKNYMLHSYGARSVETMVKQLNAYLDCPEPFNDYLTDESRYGFSWIQIKKDHPEFAPIADLAIRFQSASLSEASCERSISQQRIIFAAKRRNTKRDLLEARQKIMSASSLKPIYND